MDYRSLLSYEKKYGRCGNDLLVIIPCFMNYDVLVKHLGYLSKQTFQKFDVVIVLGPDFGDARLFDYLKNRKFGFGIIVAKRKEDTGSAGGFFTGQKYGFENGYKYMINADDDCMPVTSTLIEDLYSRREVGYVSPTTHLLVDKEYSVTIGHPTVAQYALFSRGIFAKYGLCFAPLYCGAEDGEFAERIDKEKSVMLPDVVEHPYSFAGKSVLKSPSRLWLYLLSNLVIMKLTLPRLEAAVFFGFLLSLSAFFIPMYGFGLFAAMTSLLFSYKFGKGAYDRIDASIKKTILPKSGIPAGLKIIDDASASYLEGNSGAKMLSILEDALPFFRKDALVVNTFSYLKIIVLGCFCRTLYFRLDDDHYMLMSSNANALLHIAKLLLLPFFAILYCCLLLIIYIPLKITKQPRTVGFGLD
jgi:hypothetical protein